MADSNETRYYHIVIYNDNIYTTNFEVSNDYRYCLIQDSSNNCLKLVQYYEGSGPEYGTVYYNFNYTDGCDIELGSVNFNESYPTDGTFSSYYSSSDYNDINTMLSPQLNQDIGINFIDVVDDPGDDPDDPGDEDIYTLSLYSEDSSSFITSYTSDEGVSFYVSGNNIYDVSDNVIFTFTDGFTVNQYNSGWSLDYTYDNSVNFNLSDLSNEDVNLVFHDVVNPGPEPEPRPDKTKIGGSSIRLKKIGNATVVKEVLNGVVIYTAE